MDALKKGGAFCTEAQKLSEKKSRHQHLFYIYVCVILVQLSLSTLHIILK